jgi:hypothetical protein
VRAASKIGTPRSTARLRRCVGLDAAVGVEELLDGIMPFDGNRRTVPAASRPVDPAFELVSARPGTSSPWRMPRDDGPHPAEHPGPHGQDEHRQEDHGQRTDHVRTIACAGHAGRAAEEAPREVPREAPREAKEEGMSDSVYRVTEVIGTSPTSWEEAAKNAVETAAKTLRDLRVGEVVKFDVTIEDGKVTSYRARVNISFKYEAS